MVVTAGYNCTVYNYVKSARLDAKGVTIETKMEKHEGYKFFVEWDLSLPNDNWLAVD